jgi:O-antigen/teichoic acid export membrane protein
MATALGALVALKILTELLTPEQFGTLALSLGIVALVQGLSCTPMLQALLRYYPDYAAEGRAADLCATVRTIVLKRALTLSLAGIAIGFLAATRLPLTLGSTLLLGVYFLSENWRSYEVNLLNPTRRQRGFAAVMLIDSLLRPGLAWCSAQAFGTTVEAILTGFLSASLISGLFAARINGAAKQQDFSDSFLIQGRLSTFSKPLIPLSLVQWSNGTIDRYIVAGILGTSEAGIYAAAYGLVSRPFIMVGHVVEQTIRPIYYEATSAGNARLAKRVFTAWIGLVSALCIAGVLIVVSFSEGISRLLLGPEFQAGANVMIWVACGYAVLTVAQALERQFYAQYQTRRILAIETAGLLIALIALPLCLFKLGTIGAGVAFFTGASFQCIVVICTATVLTKKYLTS